MYAGESPKEGESIYWPGAGSSQTEWHGVPEGDWSSDIRYALTHFTFQGKMAVIFIPMVLESY